MKKINTKSLIISYYLLLVTIVAGFAVNTIYQGSLRVAHGNRLAQLEQQKKELELQESQLSQKISQELSLIEINNTLDENKYQPIQISLAIQSHNKVALR
jgi:flagellar basal body-associated protein FliL